MKGIRVSEEERLLALCRYEEEQYARGITAIAGVDEVGRGALAGPVLACAVILPKGLRIPGVDDSKKLSAAKRERLAAVIREKALAVSIGMCDAQLIDEINILQATLAAMTQAVNALSPQPEMVFIDALRLPGSDLPQNSIVHGDTYSISIAAASIVAKVTRDGMMRLYHEVFSQYGFDRHKGYGTKMHIKAIQEHGLCPIHRVSFTAKFLRGL